MEKRFILTIDTNGKVAYKIPDDLTTEQLDKVTTLSVALEPSWVLIFFLKIEVFFTKIVWFFRAISEDKD
ncbi:hypothetical protein EB001_19905 [bacterium]|nr:hypothetical protein [bacterium]